MTTVVTAVLSLIIGIVIGWLLKKPKANHQQSISLLDCAGEYPSYSKKEIVAVLATMIVKIHSGMQSETCCIVACNAAHDVGTLV